jgi:hypothetical protein
MQELSQSPKPQKPMGRRAFNPTDEDRLKVSRMAALGTPQQHIAIVFGISPKTLRKHFRKELSEAAIEANFKVADTLYTMATSGKHPGVSIFWARTRNGFKASAPSETVEAVKPQSPLPTLVIVNNEGGPIAND